MKLKVLLTDGSVVTIDNMSADSFRGLLDNYRVYIPLDSMTVNLGLTGRGYISINKIATFVEVRD